MISEPELELSMSKSNRYKSYSEGSDRHLHETIQGVLHSVKRRGLRNVATSTPRSDELLAHPQKVSQRGGNIAILQWMESTIIKTSNQKDQGYHAKKKEVTKEEAPVASTSKPQANKLPQEGKKNKKKN
ncbi:hypothetical protein O181_086264 [Austropuccinia psidii MF-1]|uniref:Uncharacterized protein n=1 Tax=Austropuccinia psidii MF-1 TaxID=1389203 RepID=A0A9Q3INA7_9BASI|nr:hypothetical protein [Austropuccinia psidii MF-1]